MNISTVEYAKLKPTAAVNAREAEGYNQTDIAELAALIKAKGLIQPLVVRSGAKGAFEILAGGRRYRAIGMLIKSGDWPADREVPVVIREETDSEALETSLVENIARKPMHPVQEFSVFARVHNSGADVDQIAKRYGVTTTTVRQRLALGGLAPEIRKAWLEDAIDGDTARAFAVCRDKKAQAAAFKTLSERGKIWPHAVRQHIIQDRPRLSDARVAFVGLDRYKAAGGKLVETLFSDDGYLEDPALLDELVETRVDEVCKNLIADGWSFAISYADVKPSNAHYSWATIRPRPKFTDEAKAQRQVLDDELEKLEKAQRETEADHYDRIDVLEGLIADIDEAAEVRGYSKKQKAESGCVVCVAGDDVKIRYGLIRGKTRAQVAREKDRADAQASGDDVVDEPSTGISAALLSDITAMQTRAVARALLAAPALAIRLAAAALMPKPAGYYGLSPVRLTPAGLDKHAPGDDTDADGDENDPIGVFALALENVPEDRAAAILALHLARALDLRQHKPDELDVDCSALVAALPGEVYIAEMRQRFNPADFFKRATAAVASAALDEMAVMHDRGQKKAQLAAQAATFAVDRGWLPIPLRHPDYALKGSVAAKKRKAA